ncbi:cold shock domain-containing protein [Methylomarinum sp. Ch1-1]|uniref:Cold shock domain-containing protein n=1 Tax=Methylomarinum roseum TaxID=3067653 RepID=A0AAU7NTU0_9GAMM|nr:cold shock domain-containing protein [Methylomarinum sp. Ch1-1]MDP4519566.1 cold shock domain-containing protein [Methylomarinum sp. Ch1-1]
MAKTDKKGYLKTWKDDRGFGFIKPDDGSQDVFIHISALKGMARRPVKGDTIFFDIEEDAEGKTKASNARIEGVAIAEEQHDHINKLWLWIIAALLGLVSAAVAAYLTMK